MILGYEQPVDIPVMSIYDKEMTKMYINALREDYKDSVDAQNKFIEKYSDFTSPSATDTKWYYDNTIGGLNELLKDPNLIRSKIGRGMITQYIKSRPYGEMAKMRESAKYLEAFNSAKQKMIENGTYNKKMAETLGEDFTDWDTRTQGVFNKPAPTKYQSMEDMLLPTIQQLQKAYKYDPEASVGGYQVYRVTDDQVNAAINNDFVDLMNIPAMQYHYNTFKQQNPQLDEQSANAAFKNLIKEQIKAQTPEKREADSVKLAIMKMQHDSAEKAKDRALSIQLAAARAASENNSSGNNGTGAYTMPYSDRVQYDQQIKNVTSGNIGSIVSNMPINTRALAAYWKNKANRPGTSSRDRKIQMGFSAIWEKFPSMSADQQVKILKKYGLYNDSKEYLKKNSGNPFTKKFEKYHTEATSTFAGKSTKLHSQLVKDATGIYYSDMATVTNPQATKMYVRMISGGNKSASGKYYTGSFGKGLTYSPAHILRSTGATYATSNSRNFAETNFGDWLNRNNVIGNIYNVNNLYHGYKPNTRGGKNFEVSGISITVPYSKISLWAEKAGKMYLKMPNGKLTKGKTVNEILAGMGLSVVNQKSGKITVSKKNDSGQTTSSTTDLQKKYVVIPSSFSQEANLVNTSLMNEQFNRDFFGTSNNYNESIGSINAAVAAGK